jgi:hypothetical protein
MNSIPDDHVTVSRALPWQHNGNPMNKDQKKRRKRGDVNAQFEVIELF